MSSVTVTKPPFHPCQGCGSTRCTDGRCPVSGFSFAVLNGRSYRLLDQELSYAEIADAAKTTAPTITWRTVDGEGGSLLPGEILVVGPGVVINAFRT